MHGNLVGPKRIIAVVFKLFGTSDQAINLGLARGSNS